MGANKNQTLKAIKEAEAYDGPSLILAYSPCAEHGIKGGLSNHQKTQAKAVECGYVDLYRYNPDLEQPLTIDSKEPDVYKRQESCIQLKLQKCIYDEDRERMFVPTEGSYEIFAEGENGCRKILLNASNQYSYTLFDVPSGMIDVYKRQVLWAFRRRRSAPSVQPVCRQKRC